MYWKLLKLLQAIRSIPSIMLKRLLIFPCQELLKNSTNLILALFIIYDQYQKDSKFLTFVFRNYFTEFLLYRHSPVVKWANVQLS